MTIITNDAINFARQHLIRFEDSDFFPPLIELPAIWSEWDYISRELTSSNIQRLNTQSATAMPVAKGRHTYRIVHQLDAITAIIYTALGKLTAPIIQESRSSSGYSYRYQPEDGAFYANGSGYNEFRNQTLHLAQSNDYIATADITDFYNQIYSHRVGAAINACDQSQDNFANDVERVIHSINSSSSKGIPVGPNASGIFSEAIMIDIDQLLEREGIQHTRYVDDIRIFSNDEAVIARTLEDLSLYLYSNHRLHLNSEKTSIYNQHDFIYNVFRDHVDDELETAMGQISISNIYDHEDEVIVDIELPDADALQGVSELICERHDENGWVDNNLLKAFLRRSRQTNNDIYVETAISALESFIPVFHELAKNLEATLERQEHERVQLLIENILTSSLIERTSISMWLGWVCASSPQLLRNVNICRHVEAQSLKIQARAAVSMRNIAWVRAQTRDRLLQNSYSDRPSLILSTEILGRDERRAILHQIDERHASIVDIACARHTRNL